MVKQAHKTRLLPINGGIGFFYLFYGNNLLTNGIICYILNKNKNNCYKTVSREEYLMSKYREGYEFYCEMCERYGLEPISFRYYIIQLSQEQLSAYNMQAKKLGI